MDILNSTEAAFVENVTFENITLSNKLRPAQGLTDRYEESGATEALLFTLTFLLAFVCAQKLKIKDSGNMPGPWALPVFGNMLQLGPAPFKTMTQMRARYGDVFLAKMGQQLMVVLNGHTAISDALCRQTKDFAGRQNNDVMQEAANGCSIAFSDYDEKWRLHKRLVTKVLQKYATDKTFLHDVLNESARKLRDQFLSHDGQPFDPYAASMSGVCGAMNSLAFRGNADTPQYNDNQQKIADLMTQLQQAGPKAFITDCLPWTQKFMPDVKGEMKYILKSFDDILKSMTSVFKQDNHKKDLLRGFIKESELLSEKDLRAGMTPERLVNSVADLIGAGSDTATHSVHWLVKYLVKFPYLQDKVFDEINRVLGKDGQLSADNSDDLIYTHAVILEQMRHTSVLPMTIPHKTTRDTEFMGYLIPKDTVVVANLHSISRDESIFPDPEVFNPERFIMTTEDGRTCINTSLERKMLIFSGGLRRCPGEKIGKETMLAMVVALVKDCKFLPVPGEKYRMDDAAYSISYKSGPYKVIVERR